MNPRTPEPLSTEMESLLEKERAFLPVPADFRSRVLARARAALGTAGAVSGAAHARRTRWLFLGAAPVAFAALAFAATRDLSPFAARSDGGLPSAAAIQPPAPKVAAARPRPSEPPPASVPPPAVAPDPAVEAPPVAKQRPAARLDDDVIELRLLQRARAAIARGDNATALTVTSEHRRRFPSSRFREEGEALSIKALAGLGKNDQAQVAEERFRKRFPRSVLLPQGEESARQRP